MSNKLPPYNTGKVLIGCNYLPPQVNYETRESEFWQSVLLGEYQARQKYRVQLILYVAFLFALIILLAGFGS